LYRNTRLKTYKKATLVCLTERDRAFFAAHGVNAYLVRNFVSKSLEPFAARACDKRLIYVGRLDIPQKATDELLGLVISSGLLREGYELLLAGEGAAEGALRRMAAESGYTDKIAFLPFSRDVRALYRRGAVFLLTSNYEGFPLCVIEAMSQGLPCIAYDCPGPRDVIVDGSNGYLIAKRDPDSFVHAIRIATADGDRYAEMSSEAVRTAEQFHIKRACDEWLVVMRSVGYQA
jgi:amylovoran biosynthesis glycosyltransferase AmsD